MSVLLVFLGGAVGTAIRLGISQLQSTSASSPWPWATFLINLSGACILGFALELITTVHHGNGSESRARHHFRLFFCTGSMGGYTTFSTFVVESDILFRSSQWAVGVIYALSSVVLGLCMSVFGIWAARKIAARFGSFERAQETEDQS